MNTTLKLLIIYLIVLHKTIAQTLPFHSSKPDWLIHPESYQARITIDQNTIELNNGLLKRSFTTSPNLACYDFSNLTTNQQLLRSVKPEAKVIIDGKEYFVGGLRGQKEQAYLLPQWLKNFTVGKDDFMYKSHKISEIPSYISWKKSAWSLPFRKAGGKRLTLLFVSTNEVLKNVTISIHYDLYDGIPLLVKSLTVENNSPKSITVNRITNEILGIVEEESAVIGRIDQMKKQHGIYFESNYAFNNAMRYNISDQTTHWLSDSTYTSQVNFDMGTPCIVEIYPENVKAVELQPHTQMQSIRTSELLMDSYDRQRRGLMIQQLYALISPWVLENPIFMHMVSKNDEQVKMAIDQCQNTGYEALILSFGSHLEMEDTSAANLNRWKTLTNYAHSKGIKIGGYSLFSSRTISAEDDVINPKTGKPGGAFFGNAPCFGSKWGLGYSQKIKIFFTKTGFDIWENDGPYAGDVCAATTHPGHKNADDSQWKQMEIQKDLYHWLKENGKFINAPDWYFLDGTNKIGLGYKEVNFSLSRAQQIILNRQNIHDGTFEKLPTMNWGFVPLTKYQGGDKDTWLEPLSEHLKEYDQLMMQYYGAGVQACYRGFRLYDTDATKQKVKEVIDWYKKYRDILNSPMVHLRRADGRDWDGFLHVNPNSENKAMLMLFNPTEHTIRKKITVPLYYSGIKNLAKVSNENKGTKTYTVDAFGNIEMEVELKENSYNWFVIR